ncbi:MAG: PAS domain S-box protein [Planctomycetota bacterium]
MTDPAALSKLVDAFHLLVIACDDQGMVLEVNAAVRDRLGREPVGLRWEDVVEAPFAGARARELVRLRDAGGTLVLFRHAEQRDAAGGLTRRLSLGEDESLLRAAEAQAAEAARQLTHQKFALDQHAIVAITDRAGTITYVNDKFVEISGYAREELLGQNHRILNSGHHPRAFFRDMWRRISRGEVWRGEICNRAKSGRLYWVDTTIVPCPDAEGRIAEYVAIRAEVTERKVYEAQLGMLASLVEASSDAIVRESSEGLITSWNPGASALYGYTVGQTLGRPFGDLFPDAREPAREQGAHEVLRRRRDGREVVVSETVSAVRAEGDVVAWVRISRDVSERKLLEQRLVSSAKLAALGELAGNVAHEVNNPIGIVSGKARLLLSGRDELPPRVRRDLEKMVDQCDRVSRLTRGLLDYCRPSVQPRELLDVRIPFRKALGFVGSKALRHQVELQDELGELAPPPVFASCGELEQVALNLILNAIDAMPGGGRLHVSCAGAAHERRPGVEVLVEDTGEGIRPEHLERVFEPFFTTKDVKGTGLGLAICYGLITSHGGRIEVQSSLGAGTTFRVWLPTNEPAGDGAAGPALEPTRAGS